VISGWVLDSGVVTPEQVAAGAFAPEKPESARKKAPGGG
jgi:hypothetical protein